MSKAIRLLFVASLVLNVLLLGVLLGRLPREVGFGRQQRLEQTLKNLPEPTQNRLREKFQQMRAAADAASERSAPQADLRGTVEYKKHLAGVLVTRGLRQAFARLGVQA